MSEQIGNKKEKCELCKVSEQSINQIKKAGNRKVSSKPGSSVKTFSIIAFFTGLFSAVLGTIGAIGLCSTALSVVLGFLGISSVFLMKYNILFLVIGFILIGLAVALFTQRKKCKKI